MPANGGSSRQQFRAFLHDFLALRSPGEDVREPESPRLYWRALSWLRDNWRQTASILFLLAMATILRLVPPAMTKLAIDHVFLGVPVPAGWLRVLPVCREPRWLLVLLGVVGVVAGLVERLIKNWGYWLASRTALKLQLGLRRRLFRHVLRLPLHRLARMRAGGLTSFLREGPLSATMLLPHLACHVWQALIQLAGCLTILAMVDGRLLLGAMFALPILYWLHGVARKWFHPLHDLARQQRCDIDSHTTEAISGMRVIRVFGRQRAASVRDIVGNHKLARTDMLVARLRRGIDLAWGLIMPGASAAILVLGGFQVLAGEIRLGDLIMLLFFLAMLVEPLGQLVGHIADAQQGLAALEGINRLLAEPTEDSFPHPRITVESGSLRLVHDGLHEESVSGQFRLRNVTFGYPGAAVPALSHITLDINAGETIALVGPSGAGKTTLCNLLTRLHEPSEGVIELDGTDTRHFELDRYRRWFAIVEQEIFLFDGTVAENIAFSRRGATVDEVRRAAKLAAADEFIQNLPMGYDTPIGERGQCLSGGQRQRLALARAFLADPRILILDEATSNLDCDTENLLQQSLRRLVHGRTCIMVAHRLSTIRLADRIVVLDGGKIVHVGSHETLVARPGYYRRLVAGHIGESQFEAA